MPCKRHFAAAALLLMPMLAGGCQEAEWPPRVVERRTNEEPAPRELALLRAAMLDGHARARAAVGLPPLIWDEALAAGARDYARAMALSERFEHARQPQGTGHEGENLWTGTRDAYAYDEMFGHWAEEKRAFVNGVTPAFSRTGRWQDVAHYAQIVWHGTTRIGCAMATSATDDYLVCRYSPPGNVVGERAYRS